MYYFCRETKDVKASIDGVKSTYFLIEPTDQIGEYDNGDPILVGTNMQHARNYAKNMGWLTPLHHTTAKVGRIRL